MIRKYFALLLLGLLAGHTQAQTSFVRIYNYARNEQLSLSYVEKYGRETFVAAAAWDTILTPYTLFMAIDSAGHVSWDSIPGDGFTYSILGINQFDHHDTGYFMYGMNVVNVNPCLLYMNRNHVISWSTTYSLPFGQSGRITDLFSDKTGNKFYTLGHGAPAFAPNYNCILFQQLNTNGIREQYQFICIDSIDLGYAAAFQVPDSNLFDVFVFAEKNFGKLFLLRIDSTATVRKVKQILQNGLSPLHAVRRLKNGNFIVLADIPYEPLGGIPRMSALILSPTGDSLRLKPLGLSTSYKDVLECKNGDFVIAGGNRIIRLDSTLNVLWEKELPNIYLNLKPAETADGGILVVGKIYYPDSTSGQNGEDIIVIKLASNGTITAVTTPDSRSIEVYPNPVSDQLRIRIPASNGPFTFVVRGIDGRIVLSGHLPSQESSMDVSLLSSGIYALEVYAKDGAAFAKTKIIRE